MKHLSILILEGHLILDTIVGTLNLFKMANSYARRIGKFDQDVFKIDLLARDQKPIKCHQYFEVKPTKVLKEIEQTDLIIITSIVGDLEKAILENQSLIDWVREKRVRNDADVVSLCRSTFLLAETGLLNGKNCATHWTVHDLFKQKYPQVNLIPEKIIIYPSVS